ncbi:MAG TPA: DUF58 domain-containing protein [Verrucomicrobiales bacterium]|jgi:uncharacterized repeat protein (TIGR01451 family)|nr:DUF58 domain-containing protein [Verrucomicrobiales bacterium]
MRWLAGMIFILIVGMVFQLGLLVYAMYVLLFLQLINRMISSRWIRCVSAVRSCDREKVEINNTIEITVTLRNEGNLPIIWLLVEDLLPHDALAHRPPRLEVNGRRMAITYLGAGHEKEIRYRLGFKQRGYYQIGPMVIETGDLFGLHRRFRVVSDPRFILVLPKITTMQGYDLMSRRPVGEVRVTHRLFEDPTRINGIRRYSMGDPMNRIHWHATARTGTLHSKVFEPSSVVGLTLLFDFHVNGYPGSFAEFHSELAVSLAVSLAYSVQTMGQPLGFISNGRDAVDRIAVNDREIDYRNRTTAFRQASMRTSSERLRPVTIETRRGSAQFTRVREMLGRLELTDGMEFHQLVGEVISQMPRDASVAAIVSSVSTKSALALSELKRVGFAVICFVVTGEETVFSDSARKLIAEGIETRWLENEEGIPEICSSQMMRSVGRFRPKPGSSRMAENVWRG